jgi:pSer/pThr/pTyr-binding forkhead associated (FHA) protein
MDLKLKVLGGKHAGQEIRVPGAKFIIGRADDCHLRPGSDLISRHHCAIMVDDGYIALRDFGSKNGTYVNGERVAGETELHAGDNLKVGPLEFEVVIKHELVGKKRPPVTDLKEAAARTAEGKDDLDVSQWLTGTTDAAGETQRFRIEETNDVAMLSTREVDVPAPPAAEPQPAAKADPPAPKGKKVFGKLPPVPTTTTKDSRDAAANMLDQLRKRR